MVKPVNRYLLIIAIGFCAASCKADLGPWTEPYDSYNSGIKINGKEYHIPVKAAFDYGGLSMDDVLRVNIEVNFCSTNNRKDDDSYKLCVEAYIDSITVSGVQYQFELMTEENPFSSKHDSLNACFINLDNYGRVETPRVISGSRFFGFKDFYIKSGTITFWVGRSWAGSEPRERLWSFKRCNFEFVAEASDGERIVVTEGYLGRK